MEMCWMVLALAVGSDSTTVMVARAFTARG
jgi:hypothetical protein